MEGKHEFFAMMTPLFPRVWWTFYGENLGAGQGRESWFTDPFSAAQYADVLHQGFTYWTGQLVEDLTEGPADVFGIKRWSSRWAYPPGETGIYWMPVYRKLTCNNGSIQLSAANAIETDGRPSMCMANGMTVKLYNQL